MTKPDTDLYPPLIKAAPTIFGVLFGISIVLISLILEMYVTGLSWSYKNFIQIHQNNPVLFIIGTAPVILGVMFFIIGQQHFKLRQSVAETQREKKLLQTFIDTVPGHINMKDASGNYLLMNQFQRDYFGWEPHDIIGKSITPHAENAKEHHAVLQSRKTEVFERELTDKNGNKDWWLHSRSPILDEQGHVAYVATSALNISERKLYEQKYAQTAKELEAILENASLGIFVVSTASRAITRVNKQFENMMGYSREELLGQNTRLFYLSDEDWAALGQRAYPKLAQGQTHREEVRWRDKGGSLHWIMLTGAIVDPDNGEDAIWLIDDVTARREAEEAVRQKEKELQRKTDLLETTFSNISQGIAFVDEDYKVAVCNSVFLDMLDFPKELGREGTPVEELFRYRALKGNYGSGDVEEFVKKRMERTLSGDTHHFEYERSNGTTLEVVGKKMPSGGFVNTYTDITQHKNAQQQISSLLNHADQGFLSFGPDLIVHPQYSLACTNFFGTKPANHKITDLLGNGFDQEFFDSCIHQVFNSPDEFQKQMFLGLLPKEFGFNQQYFSASYRFIDERHLMMVLTNISEERRLEEELTSSHDELKMIVNYVRERKTIQDLINDFRVFLARLEWSIEDGGPDWHETYRQIHTFKGLFMQFSFRHLTDAIHRSEDNLQKLSKDHKRQELVDSVDAKTLFKALDLDLAIIVDQLGDAHIDHHSAPQHYLYRMQKLQKAHPQLEQDDTFISLMDEVKKSQKKEMKNLLSPYLSGLELIAEKANRKVDGVEFCGDEIYVHAEEYRPFLKSLIHVFRNAVKHGIEETDKRIEIGKPEEGKVTCELLDKQDFFEMKISDDGHGIDVNAITNKAISLGLIDPIKAEGLNHQEKMMLIFQDEFSTTEEANELSGRGIGLSAVKKELDDLNGSVKVETTPLQGTSFTFSLPYEADQALNANSSN
ncbi:PAS-domain containing protein [Terasakiella sp. SH-1]|uniref:PAS-domain containing protein n=1 Tax=Terasakiella sp. SH-1 TaxID=2560057 RepID=UPI00107339E1|nr:PAS-domain containing protein [Terasakiella sp. SH-1]